MYGGGPETTDHIVVNGIKISVRHNLYRLLRQLQLTSTPHLGIWVDAVCINQGDLEERVREVQKMDMIYSEALSVRAWIGSPPEEPDVQRHFVVVRDWLDEVKQLQLRPEQEHTLFDRCQGNSSLDESIWRVSSMIMDEPYWERLWIIQEIALSRSMVFWYGTYRYSTGDLFKMLGYVNHTGILACEDRRHPLSVACGGLEAMLKVRDHQSTRQLRILQLQVHELVLSCCQQFRKLPMRGTKSTAFLHSCPMRCTRKFGS
jgi:hypothetical protein